MIIVSMCDYFTNDLPKWLEIINTSAIFWKICSKLQLFDSLSLIIKNAFTFFIKFGCHFQNENLKKRSLYWAHIAQNS